MGRPCKCCAGCKYLVYFMELIEIGEVDLSDPENPIDNLGDTGCFIYSDWRSPFQRPASFLDKSCVPNIEAIKIDKCFCNKTYPMITKINIKNDNELIIEDDTSYIGIDSIEYKNYSDGCSNGKYHRNFSKSTPFFTSNTLINHEDEGKSLVQYNKYIHSKYGTAVYYQDKIIQNDKEIQISDKIRKLYIFGPILSYISFSNRNLLLNANTKKCNKSICFLVYSNDYHSQIYDNYEYCNASNNISKGTPLFQIEINDDNKYNVNLKNEIYDKNNTVIYPILNKIKPPNIEISPNRSKIKFNANMYIENCTTSATNKILNFSSSIELPIFFNEFDSDTYGDGRINCGGLQTFYQSFIKSTDPISNIQAPEELNGWSVYRRFGPGAMFQSKKYPIKTISYNVKWGGGPLNRVLSSLISDYYYTGNNSEFFSYDYLDYNKCGILNCNNSIKFFTNPQFNNFKSFQDYSAEIISDLNPTIDLVSLFEEIWNTEKKVSGYYYIYGSIADYFSTNYCTNENSIGFPFIYGQYFAVFQVYFPPSDGWNGNTQSLLVFVDPNGKEYLPIEAPSYRGGCNIKPNHKFTFIKDE